MLNYTDSINMPLLFGEFGGNSTANDLDIGRLHPDIEFIKRTISSDEFELEFRRVLRSVCEDFTLRRVKSQGGRELLIVPDLSVKYALAARIAYAKQTGKKQVAIGSYQRDVIVAAVRASLNAGLEISVNLSNALAQDDALVKELKDEGVLVDNKTSKELFDLPYSYLEIPFASDPPAYRLQVEANYGLWPVPALTGILAGLYGADLADKIGHAPEAIVVPITTGTEAIGVFKGFAGKQSKLFTVEPTVAQEIHMINAGAYTIATRNANREAPNIPLCPELVNMWRSNQVLRLGCDRIRKVDTAALEDIALSEVSKRAVALVSEKMGWKELLVVEE